MQISCPSCGSSEPETSRNLSFRCNECGWSSEIPLRAYLAAASKNDPTGTREARYSLQGIGFAQAMMFFGFLSKADTDEWIGKFVTAGALETNSVSGSIGFEIAAESKMRDDPVG